jgi:hypothetical protein
VSVFDLPRWRPTPREIAEQVRRAGTARWNGALIEYAEPHSYYVGADVGQSSDYFAVAVLEEPCWIPSSWSEDLDQRGLAPPGVSGWVSPADLVPVQRRRARAWNWLRGRPADVPLRLRRLHRWPLGTKYHDVVADLARMFERPPLSEHPSTVVLDANGVGAAIHDQLTAAGFDRDRLAAVISTAGYDPEPRFDQPSATLRISKTRVVLAPKVLLERRQLEIGPRDPLAGVLAEEFRNFVPRYTEAGNLIFGGRAGHHDDLVMATALAAWYRQFRLGLVDATMARAGKAGDGSLAGMGSTPPLDFPDFPWGGR